MRSTMQTRTDLHLLDEAEDLATLPHLFAVADAG
jgi:hypothetical protein